MANNLTIKDSAAVDKIVKTTDNGGVHTPHQNVDTLATITNVVHVDDNSTTLSVDDGGGALTVDNAGTFAVQAEGKAADDSPVSGAPVRVGAKAVSALPAAVSTGDTKDLLTDLQGRLLVIPLANPENVLTGNPVVITDNVAHDLIAAQGAGQRIYLTSVLVTNANTLTGTLVTIQDDTGAKLCQGYASPNGGGFFASFQVPACTGVNQKLQAICGTTGTNVYVSVIGYKGV